MTGDMMTQHDDIAIAGDDAVLNPQSAGDLRPVDLIAVGDRLMSALAQAASGAEVALLSVNADLVGLPQIDDLLAGTAQVTRATRSVVFISAALTRSGRPAATLTALYRVIAVG